MIEHSQNSCMVESAGSPRRRGRWGLLELRPGGMLARRRCASQGRASMLGRGLLTLLLLLATAAASPADPVTPTLPPQPQQLATAVAPKDMHTVHLVMSHHLDVGLDLPMKITADCVSCDGSPHPTNQNAPRATHPRHTPHRQKWVPN